MSLESVFFLVPTNLIENCCSTTNQEFSYASTCVIDSRGMAATCVRARVFVPVCAEPAQTHVKASAGDIHSNQNKNKKDTKPKVH